MLIRFSVSNYLCFADEAVLSMVASNDASHPSHLIQRRSKRQHDLLRVTALYGANAHGKTNFVEAVSMLREIVVNRRDANAKLLLRQHKLNKKVNTSPTRFNVVFRIDRLDFEYEISVNQTYIVEEWLSYVSASGGEEIIFERTTSKTSKGFATKSAFGKKFLQSKYKKSDVGLDVVTKVMTANLGPLQTMVNELSDLNVLITDRVYGWFRSVLTPVSATASYSPLHSRAKSDRKFLSQLSKFMKFADVGIASVNFEERPLDLRKLPDSLSEMKTDFENLEEDDFMFAGNEEGVIVAFRKDKKGGLVACQLVANREDSESKLVRFNMSEESAGTRRLIDLLPMTLGDQEDRVYVVDELDRKLHPLLARKLIELFYIGSRGQLIFTTHNTSLMDLSIFRKDEIWFVQKTKAGFSDLYSLAELKIRPELDIRKGYLLGRFGAIPFLADPASLGWAETNKD